MSRSVAIDAEGSIVQATHFMTHARNVLSTKSLPSHTISSRFVSFYGA